MKEKILSALKAAIVGKDGKTSISDKTLDAYAGIIAAQITEESQIPEAIKPYIDPLKEVQSNINSVAAKAAEDKETAVRAELGKNPAPAAPPDGDDNAKFEAFFEAKVKPLAEKLQAYEAKEAQENRRNTITAKAKELGIPDWRISEGFTIPEDADDVAITSSLTAVKQNLVTAGLGGKNTNPMAMDVKEPTKEELDAVAAKLNI